MQRVRSACSLAAAKAGSSSAAKMAMVVMTTSSSMSVKPRDAVLKRLFKLFVMPAKPNPHSPKPSTQNSMRRFEVQQQGAQRVRLGIGRPPVQISRRPCIRHHLRGDFYALETKIRI